MKTENLFAVPVFHTLYDDFDILNKNIRKDLNSYSGTVSNFFDVPGEGIKSLHDRIWEESNHISKVYNWPSQPKQITGRFNAIDSGGCDTPHTHGAMLVGVYYLDVPDNSGDILLHDTRGYVSWPNLNFNPADPLNRTSRCYHRVRPVNGMLILFPGFLAHSVETNMSNRKRISIVLNVYI